jgi:hypothetical protein
MNAVIAAPAAAHHWTGRTFGGVAGAAGVPLTLDVTVAIVPLSVERSFTRAGVYTPAEHDI